MNRNTVITRLKKAFPKINGICCGEELGYSEESIFLGDVAEGGEINGIPACDYYAEDPYEKVYILGVHKELHNKLEELGWFAECHNPGVWVAYQ